MCYGAETNASHFGVKRSRYVTVDLHRLRVKTPLGYRCTEHSAIELEFIVSLAFLAVLYLVIITIYCSY